MINSQNPHYQYAADEDNELKKKREQNTIDIRSKQREEILKRKREIPSQSTSTVINKYTIMLPSNLPSEESAKLHEIIIKALNNHFKIEDFPSLLEQIHSTNIYSQHYGVIGIRKLLSIQQNTNIQLIVDANTVPRLLEMMKMSEYPHLIYESTWSVTNIACGTTQQTQSIIDKGGVTLIVGALFDSYPEIVDLAIWAIANISGDCSQFRDLILKLGACDQLSKIVSESTSFQTIKQGTWALSNLCRGKPLPDFKFVAKSLPVFCQVISTQSDLEILSEASWALSYLSDGDNQRVQQVIDSGVIPFLLHHISQQNLNILVPMLRSLGNIASGNDIQCSYLLNLQTLQVVEPLLAHHKKVVRREACWLLSNITAGNTEQIKMVIQNKQILEKLIKCCSDLPEVQKEAIYALKNAIFIGSKEDIIVLLQSSVIAIFINILKENDPYLIIESIKTLDKLMEKCELFFGSYIQFMQEFNIYKGNTIMEELQTHENDQVYICAYEFIHKYFEIQVPSY